MTLHHPIRLFFILYFVFCIFLACEKATAPVMPAGTAIGLQAEYVGVTEAWLRLTVKLPVDEGTIKLWRDGHLLWEKPLTQVDSLVYDSTLAPAQRYSYRAQLWQQGEKLGESAAATITTLDTTSHDFQWEIVEFPSPFGSGALYDVAIINENDIWAVGEIYSDSNQTWLPYNAVHWDGSEWELKRIQFRYFCDQPGTFPAPASSILAFNENDILIAAGSQIAQWNGQSQDKIECIPVSVNKLWGTDKNNVYAVGALGKIAHYDGQRWQRIESPPGAGVTELPIQDIWGAWNELTGEWEIIAVASNKYLNEGKRLLSIKDTRVTPLPDTGLSWSLSSVWFIPCIIYYVAGAGIYPKRKTDWNKPWYRYPSGVVTRYFTNRIRGDKINNVFAVGAFGEVVHFNGMSWRNYYEETQLTIGTYYGLDVRDNRIVAVGQLNRSGVILIGNHSP